MKGYCVDKNCYVIDMGREESLQEALTSLVEKTSNLSLLKENIIKLGSKDVFGKTENVFSFNFGHMQDEEFSLYAVDNEPPNTHYHDYLEGMWKNIEEMRKNDPDNPSLQHDINRYEAIKIKTNEQLFFNEIIKYDSLLPLLQKYVNQLTSLHYQYSIPNATYQGDPAGLSAATSLAKSNEKYISDYIAFLCASGTRADSHSKYDEIVARFSEMYGFSDEICCLIFAQILMNYNADRSSLWQYQLKKPGFKTIINESVDIVVDAILRAIVDTSFGETLTESAYKNGLEVFLEDLLQENDSIGEYLISKNLFPKITSELLNNQNERQNLDLLPNQVEVDLDDSESIKKAIERVIEIVSDGNLIKAVMAENDYDEFIIDLGYKDEKGIFHSHEGDDIAGSWWEQELFSDTTNMDHLIREYGQTIIHYNETHSSPLFLNDEEYAGSHALLNIALENELDILWFIRFLRTNDLDHEVYQGEQISSLITKYGWGEFTLQLLAARLTMAGQHSFEDLESYLKSYNLAEYLQEEANIIHFCQLLNWSNYHHFGKDKDFIENIEKVMGKYAPELVAKFRNYAEMFAENYNVPVDVGLSLEHIKEKVNYPQGKEKGIYKNIIEELQTPYGLITHLQTTDRINKAAFDPANEELFFSTINHYYAFCGTHLDNLQTFSGNTGHYLSVKEIAIDQIGKYIAACVKTESKLFRFQIINRITGEMVVDDEFKAGEIAISPNGKYVAAAYDELAIVSPRTENAGLVRIWDTESGDIITDLKEHILDVQALTFSPDSELLITTGVSLREGTYVWKTSDWQLHGGFFCGGESVAVSGNGKMAAVVGHDNVYIWDLSNCQPIMKTEQIYFPEEPYYVSVTFSPDNRYVIAGDTSHKENEETTVGAIQVFEIETGKAVANLVAHSDAIVSLDVNSQRNWLLTASRDNLIKVWNFDTLVSYCMSN